MHTRRMSDSVRRVTVRLTGPDLDALVAVRAQLQRVYPSRAVDDAEVLRSCLREQAGRVVDDGKRG